MEPSREGNFFKKNTVWMNSSIEGRNMDTPKLTHRHNLKVLKESRYRRIKNSFITSLILTQLHLLGQ